jgi:hypothetical protein
MTPGHQPNARKSQPHLAKMTKKPEKSCQAPKLDNSLKTSKIDVALQFPPLDILKTAGKIEQTSHLPSLIQS